MTHEVFIRRDDKPETCFTVGTILDRRPAGGDVGIEIEVEGSSLPKPPDVPSPWVYKTDGSLRGEDNGEYVLGQPVRFDKIEGYLKSLWKAFEKSEAHLDDSNRTSVHVHLNCQDFHLNRLTAFLALYFTLEEALTAWCGETRVGNLFCLRAKDAPAIVSQLRRFIRSDGRSILPGHLHYGGLNPHSIVKFGSIEIRSLRGCTDYETIFKWVEILRRIYDKSADFTDPRDICGLFSQMGPMPFFENILGGLSETVRVGSGMSGEEIRDSLYEGIRLGQDLCYCRDWSRFKGVDIKDDPFGRNKSKVGKKIASVEFPEIEQLLSEI